jgi:hypothetical protein
MKENRNRKWLVAGEVLPHFFSSYIGMDVRLLTEVGQDQGRTIYKVDDKVIQSISFLQLVVPSTKKKELRKKSAQAHTFISYGLVGARSSCHGCYINVTGPACSQTELLLVHQFGHEHFIVFSIFKNKSL